MSCFSSTVNTPTAAEPDPAKHVNYNLGMVLGVDDFTQEFAYLSGRDQWMTRDLIGYGTVRGLKVQSEVDATRGPRIIVEPGVAVSPRGQMICVPTAQCAYLRNWATDHANEVAAALSSPPGSSLRLYVVLCYRDCPTDSVPIAGEPCRSEDNLMAPSRLSDDFCLQLRFEKPNQREEDAVRDFVGWLKGVEVSAVKLSTPLDQFLQAIRDAALQWFPSPPASPLTSPLSDYMFGSPPGFLHINVADACDYMRAALLLWVTELRPKWIARWHGCAATHFEGDNAADEDCVLLAELTVPVLPLSPGWEVTNTLSVVNEAQRPYVVHLRMLQELLLCAGRTPAASRQLKITNLKGGTTITLTGDHEFIACDTKSGGIEINLPPAADNDGRVYIIKRFTTGSKTTINRTGVDLIDGKTFIALTTQFKFLEVVANAQLNAWHVISFD